MNCILLARMHPHWRICLYRYRPTSLKPDGLFRCCRRLGLREREAFCLLAAFGVFLDVVFAFIVSHRPQPDTLRRLGTTLSL